jgi:hypothetical protein
MLEKDFNYSKIHKMAKDQDVYDRLFEFCLENVHELLDVFFYMTSHSVYPQIGMIDFGMFSRMLGIIEENLSGGVVGNDIDLAFISTYSAKPMEKPNNVSNVLCRFEFFEIFVRMAKIKYIEKGKGKLTAYQIDEAVKCLFNDHFKNLPPTIQPQRGYRFREDHVCQLNIADLIKSN